MNHKYNISPEELEQIERYITGDMRDHERNEFEELLNADPQLKEKAEEVRLLMIGISEHALSGKLDDFHKEIIAARKNSSVVPFGRKLLMAASILTVTCLTVWWFVVRKSADEALYAKFYSPDPGLATVMGSSSAYDFEKAMVEYKNGEYDKALTAWTNLLKDNPSSDTLNYFIGAAYQAKADERSAAFLEKVASDTSSVFYKDACWYLGLYYMKTAQKEKALEFIQRSGHPKSAEAINAINKE